MLRINENRQYASFRALSAGKRVKTLDQDAHGLIFVPGWLIIYIEFVNKSQRLRESNLHYFVAVHGLQVGFV